jgi:hypothetical protein
MLHDCIRKAPESFTEARKNAYHIIPFGELANIDSCCSWNFFQEIVDVSDDPCLAGLI